MLSISTTVSAMVLAGRTPSAPHAVMRFDSDTIKFDTLLHTLDED